MKNTIKYILQKLLGFKNYLFVFSKFKIRTLHKDKKEGDFFLFMEQLPNEGILLDIGANIGIMTVHLAQRFPNTTVWAIEPVEVNYNTLERIVERYKLQNVELMRLALGNSEGEVEMVMPVEGNVKQQGLSHVVHDSITEFNEGIKSTVPLKRLDSLVNEKADGRKVNGIKMDVENFEYFVLDGGRELLLTHRPPIYTELWENENRQKCFDLAKELNYTIQVARDGKLVDFDPTIDKGQNFIFTPQ